MAALSSASDTLPADSPLHHVDDATQLAAWDRHYFWHSFTQMQEYDPLVISRGEGVWLIDTEGQRHLDAAASQWCNVHGHAHPHINRVMIEQIERISHTTSLGMGGETTVRLAKRLADLAPGDLQHVFFASDGSSALEVAMKAAFQYWQQRPDPLPAKTRFLAFDLAYHGDTIGAASLGGIDRFHALFKPLLFDAIRGLKLEGSRLPAGTTPAQACKQYLEATEQLFKQHGHELAAAVIEPLVQCAAGMLMHPPGFLRGLRELCDQYDVLLIADEVAVGFGKTGTLFACEQEEVVPDMLCLGKGLSGGNLPIAATLFGPEIYNAFLGDAASARTLYHGHSFSGNPLCAAAAMGCLDVFEQEQTIAKLQNRIEHLEQRWQEVAAHPLVSSARQCGIIAAADLVCPTTGAPLMLGPDVAKAAMKHNVWLRPQPSMVYVMPPLCITEPEIDRLVDAVLAGLEAVSVTL